ncbi:MAG: exodeoxyribonuclease VII small subunit [Planctomycetota bacterium]|jgi:exodeoxyribonuclease VII small subunit
MPAKKKKKATQPAEEEHSFESSLEALEAIVRRLDGETLGVEEAMVEYEKGLLALKRCRRILDEAEKKLEILVKEEDGKAKTKPFQEGENPPPDPAEPKKTRKGKSKTEETDEPKEGFLF